MEIPYDASVSAKFTEICYQLIYYTELGCMHARISWLVK